MLRIVRRVEKYRPDTLADVSGHQDIIATINRFVESNVRFCSLIPAIVYVYAKYGVIAPPASPTLRAPGHGQDVDDPGSREADLREQEYAADGA